MSTFGTYFRVTTYGESHCKSVGCIVDGVPPGMALTEDDIQPQLSRRRPGQSKLSTPRSEADAVEIQSGTEFGKTLGTSIGMIVRNKDQRPHDYSETDVYPRPSHADYTYLTKYGIKASSGGGRSSARETIGRVAAGAIAEKFLKLANGVEIVAFVSGVGSVAVDRDPTSKKFHELLSTVTREQVDQAGPIRCPDPEVADKMVKIIEDHRDSKDSIGGVVTCVVRNLPVGLGEPVFDKLEALLAHAMLSIPATKGFEIGSGFAGTSISGSEHNDPFYVDDNGRFRTSTNYSGGIQGGISNGENIYFNVAFKSPATISQQQQTSSYDGVAGVLEARGRHDPNVVPRAIPIVEAMTALVLADTLLLQKAREASMSIVNPK
ncbi:bifunctional chorismate synthase/riboflavin reductase [NAD(P)H] ARO2 [Sugiyamaella lignohabitans]|uniref:Chorismate synthase n=1 Tax=Sugiyamaella lignohabitans TaxID=796027 RepID=A0A167FVD9_9ASCO|nr:bifunctional chorismate synthase/riboflavin reductase [NAD(P)H] ARO2 [Sugiyamaella lignohabitans]ANB15746.1 bifunctional chorismate synthase/riboflavin reductase [NAD(P)H] ARO2 [Sugiyamaella lignohabitans]